MAVDTNGSGSQTSPTMDINMTVLTPIIKIYPGSTSFPVPKKRSAKGFLAKTLYAHLLLPILVTIGTQQPPKINKFLVL
jgi:hypothetical protein